VDLVLVEHLAGDKVAGREFAVFMRDSLFLECRRNITSSLDLHRFIATAMENPDADVFEVRDVTDIGGAGERHCSGKEVRALVDEVPNPIAAERKSREIDPFGVSDSGILKKIVEKGDHGFSGLGHPCLSMIALWSNENARTLGHVGNE